MAINYRINEFKFINENNSKPSYLSQCCNFGSKTNIPATILEKKTQIREN
jgi:hypothetical protein